MNKLLVRAANLRHYNELIDRLGLDDRQCEFVPIDEEITQGWLPERYHGRIFTEVQLIGEWHPEEKEQLTKWGRLIPEFKNIGHLNELEKTNNEQIAVYIAGMITGLDDYKRHFDEAEVILRALGYKVINPTVLPPDLDYEAYFPICFGMIESSHVLYCLHNALSSRGAKREIERAQLTDKTLVFEEDTKYRNAADIENKIKMQLTARALRNQNRRTAYEINRKR